jgi:DNA-binding LacI/PurR family transcriptional regulator
MRSVLRAESRGEDACTVLAPQATHERLPIGRQMRASFLRRGTEERLVDKIPRAFFHELFMHPTTALDDVVNMHFRMQDTFRAAMADRSITAWVCANDYCALSALHFLSGHPAHTRNRISVVGFDNVRFGVFEGLTSYDFDFRLIGRVAADRIMNPRRYERMDTISVKGKLVRRHSARMRV